MLSHKGRAGSLLIRLGIIFIASTVAGYLPTRGRYGVCRVALAMQACSFVAAMRFSIRGLLTFPNPRSGPERTSSERGLPPEGGGAPKSANPMVSAILLKIAAGASRRATPTHVGAHFAATFPPHTGPRFRREYPAAAPSARWGNLSALGVERGVRQRLA